MKALQLAVSPDSVYALGMIDQVRCIERGVDGFWRAWQNTGAKAKRVVHGGGVIARIGLDDRVSAFQRRPPGTRVTWDLRATELVAAHTSKGAPALFATADDRVWHAWKSTPSSPWSEWESLDGPVAGIDADRIPGGGLAVFGISGGTVYHNWQERPFSGWRGWTGLDAPPGGAKALRVTTIARGGLVVFAVGGDHALYHRWQDRPFGRWHPWETLAGAVKRFTVTKSPRGGLTVAAIGLDDQVRCRSQPKRFGAWGPWLDLRGKAKSIAAEVGYATGVEVFTIGLDDEVYHTWYEEPGERWRDWTLLDQELSPLRQPRSVSAAELSQAEP
jgi:hypothetical protein